MADEALTIASLIIASVAAISAALAFWANHRMVIEMQRDRRIVFITTQLEQLYNPILRQRNLFFTPKDRYGTNIWETELYPVMIQKSYLAGPKLFKAIASCPSMPIAVINTSAKTVGTDNEMQLLLTDAVYMAAEEEYEELRKEMQSIIWPGESGI